MWLNPLFDDTHRASALAMVRENTLATLVVGDPLRVAHMPVLLKERPDGDLELVGHIPREDPVADAVVSGSTFVVVFHGARTYISPDWYVESGLPTYNYLVAHLEGTAVEMTDPEDLRAHLLDLTHTLEAGRRDGGAEWTFDEVACAQMEELMPLIVGFQIPVVSMQVKAKLGQNRPVVDRANVTAVLGVSDDGDDRAIAQRMLQLP